MTGERWMRALAAMPEVEVVSMLTIGVTELAYRHRCTIDEILQRIQGLPDPFEPTVDAKSGAETARKTTAGACWEAVTGRCTLKRDGRQHRARRLRAVADRSDRPSAG